MPKQTVTTKYYHFSQNNSGGKFYNNVEHGVGPEVIIEGMNAEHAYSRLEDIPSDYTGMYDNCSCCGDRWYAPDDDEGTDEPMVYGEKVSECKKDSFRQDAFIHHYDGSIEHVEFKD